MIVNIAQFIILGLIVDWAFRKINIPGLLGMILLGLLFGPYALGLISSELLSVSGDFRLIALIVILLRAGFELSKKVLKSAGSRIILLAVIPAIIEGATVMFLGPPLLGLNLMESLILGSILAAVSPAVVFPIMISFKKRGMGAKKNIPAMILAMASLDDVFVIFVYSVLIGSYTGASTNLTLQILSIPLSIIFGIITGLIIGFLLYKTFWYFNIRTTKRVLILLGLSILLIQVEHLLQPWVSFTALLSIMAMGFMILEKDEYMAQQIALKLEKIWVFAEIVLFTIVGAQVNFEVAIQAGFFGVMIIILGLIARSIGTYICLIGSNLNTPERFFVIISYLPKATVQAAIGAAPLAAMTLAGMETAPGEVILAVAFLSIILTAPIGAWAISVVGERILEVEPQQIYNTR
jgi:NhaP-type Na+/H+ or K+/H+ antiporter